MYAAWLVSARLLLSEDLGEIVNQERDRRFCDDKHTATSRPIDRDNNTGRTAPQGGAVVVQYLIRMSPR